MVCIISFHHTAEQVNCSGEQASCSVKKMGDGHFYAFDMTVCSGNFFHSFIVRGKKENLKLSLFAFGIRNLKGWLSC